MKDNAKRERFKKVAVKRMEKLIAGQLFFSRFL